MTNLKVGDKVEILSDCGSDSGYSVFEWGWKSAIRKIGTIKEIDNDGDYMVNNLGKECGYCWYYKANQLRKVEDNEDKKKTKMEDK